MGRKRKPQPVKRENSAQRERRLVRENNSILAACAACNCVFLEKTGGGRGHSKQTAYYICAYSLRTDHQRPGSIDYEKRTVRKGSIRACAESGGYPKGKEPLPGKAWRNMEDYFECED